MTDTILTGQQIIDTIPLGAVIAYADGTAEPPKRFTHKHAKWRSNNGSGRLVAKSPASDRYPGSFTLHTGDYGTAQTIVLRTRVCIMANTGFALRVLELPPAGAVRILSNGELVYLAANRSDAEAWLASNRYSDAVLDKNPAAA